MIDPPRLQIAAAPELEAVESEEGCCLPDTPTTLRSAKHVHHAPLVLAQTDEPSPTVRSHSLPTVCSPNSELPLTIQNP